VTGVRHDGPRSRTCRGTGMRERDLRRSVEPHFQDVVLLSGDRFKSAERASLFPSHGCEALYQGTTLVGPYRAQKIWGFSPWALFRQKGPEEPA